MPVVVRFGRFKFVIYPKDHRPAHVHVVSPSAEAKFDLATGQCLASWGYSQRTIGQLQSLVDSNRDLLKEAWEEYEGQE